MKEIIYYHSIEIGFLQSAMKQTGMEMSMDTVKLLLEGFLPSMCINFMNSISSRGCDMKLVEMNFIQKQDMENESICLSKSSMSVLLRFGSYKCYTAFSDVFGMPDRFLLAR